MTVNNLYVSYDGDGQPCFHVNDKEVTREAWMRLHPEMKEGKTNGRNPDSGRVGRIDQGAVTPEQQRQRIREHRAEAKAQRANGDQVGA